MDFAAHGIFSIDTELQRPGFDAAWLVVEQGRAAFIDCGTSHSVPAMLQALATAGLTPDCVDWLILTHIHLDHAGGTGSLLKHLPHATVVVHPRGAAHLIDPSRLMASATAVYGEAEMARHYGVLEPVPADRLQVPDDGQTIELAGRPLTCLHTPGHAIHHQCIWDERSRSWFAGDTFGIAYRELSGPQGDFIIPTSSPTQFDPDQLVDSIQRLLARQPQGMHLTHYGTATLPAALGTSLQAQIRDMADMALAEPPGDDREERIHDRLLAYWQARAAQAGLAVGTAMATLAIDIRLNAQGLVCWLDRIKR